jgi:hypothetical protein
VTGIVGWQALAELLGNEYSTRTTHSSWLMRFYDQHKIPDESSGLLMFNLPFGISKIHTNIVLSTINLLRPSLIMLSIEIQIGTPDISLTFHSIKKLIKII